MTETRQQLLDRVWRVEADRGKAERISRSLNNIRKLLVKRIEAIKRKRSWEPSVRAMAIADVQIDLQHLIEVHEAYQKANGIGGY